MVEGTSGPEPEEHREASCGTERRSVSRAGGRHRLDAQLSFRRAGVPDPRARRHVVHVRAELRFAVPVLSDHAAARLREVGTADVLDRRDPVCGARGTADRIRSDEVPRSRPLLQQEPHSAFRRKGTGAVQPASVRLYLRRHDRHGAAEAPAQRHAEGI